MKNVYIDSTLHNPWNVDFNPKLCDALEKKGVSVFLPQRDTDQKDRPNIYANDMKGLDGAKVVLAVANNESPNWGTEVGYAFGKGKKVVVLVQEDHSIPLLGRNMAMDILSVKNLENINEYIEELVKMVSVKS